MNMVNSNKSLQKYYYFSFDEPNFINEKNRLLDFLGNLGGGITVRSLKMFPPCILDNGFDLEIADDEIILSNNDFLVGHNIFFGEEYIEVNKRYKNPPFISDKCKECKQFKSFFCRGLFNKKFLDVKEEIIRKRSKFHYDTLMMEYNQGVVGHTSDCNFNCYSCDNKIKKQLAYTPFIQPSLSLKEILHFLHYLPSNGALGGTLYLRCVSGEPLMHKDIKKILSLTKPFVLWGFYIITNGYFLNDELLELISKLDYHLLLSVNSVNKENRKRLMGYNDDINIKDLINDILKRKIKLTPLIVALKENITNGGLKESILYLKERGLKPVILANMCYMGWGKDKVKNLNYKDEFLMDYLKNNNLYGFVDTALEPTIKLLPKFIASFKDYLNRFNGKKILILCPEQSYNTLNESLKDFKDIYLVCLTNSLRENRTLACSLTVDVFLDALSKIDHDYDLIIAPMQSFNILMKDLKGQSINELVLKIDKKVVLFGKVTAEFQVKYRS